jgi:hypothetical protein
MWPGAFTIGTSSIGAPEILSTSSHRRILAEIPIWWSGAVVNLKYHAMLQE